jgi:hypothetical protein
VTETNVFQLSQPGTFADPLTEVLRNGARALLVQAVEAEVSALLDSHAEKRTAEGRQRLVRHGHLPEREIMTGIGAVAVRCPLVRDRGCATAAAQSRSALAFRQRSCRPTPSTLIAVLTRARESERRQAGGVPDRPARPAGAGWAALRLLAAFSF